MTDAMGAPRHLWEFEHPYYTSDTNFLSNDYTHRAGSWGEFIDEMGGFDIDLNLVVRWDWRTPEGPGERHELQLTYVLQRKGIYMVWLVTVTPDDEAAVREFLQPHWERLRENWAGIS